MRSRVADFEGDSTYCREILEMLNLALKLLLLTFHRLHTSYLFISSISSLISCSALLAAAPCCPRSALVMANERRLENEGLNWVRGDRIEKEEEREVITSDQGS
jgi:hypothetical protein